MGERELEKVHNKRENPMELKRKRSRLKGNKKKRKIIERKRERTKKCSKKKRGRETQLYPQKASCHE